MGKKVIIGGISGTIGAAIAKQLRREDIAVSGFSRASEHHTTYQEEHAGETILTLDATNSNALKEAVPALIGEADEIAYIHAIGSIFLKPAHLVSDEEWDQTLTTNLCSAFYALRSFLPAMQKKRTGSFVFFSSVAAQIGLASHEAIAAAKAGIDGMVKSSAASYASFGIRVNAIAPGLVDTKLAQGFLSHEKSRKVSESMHPLARVGKAEEIASLATWLVSEQGSWMTGQTLSLDGGMSSILPKPRA